MGGDPIEATRNISAEDQLRAAQAARVLKHLRGFVFDAVREMARMTTGSASTAAEEVEFADRVMIAASDYMEAKKSRTAAITYTTPGEIIARIKAQTLADEEGDSAGDNRGARAA